MPHVNLRYSPLLFSKPWTRLMGKPEEEIKALTAWVMAIVVNHFRQPVGSSRRRDRYALLAGFRATTSFATALFPMQPKGLWLINSGYNLVSFVLAGIILAVWR